MPNQAIPDYLHNWQLNLDTNVLPFNTDDRENQKRLLQKFASYEVLARKFAYRDHSNQYAQLQHGQKIKILDEIGGVKDYSAYPLLMRGESQVPGLYPTVLIPQKLNAQNEYDVKLLFRGTNCANSGLMDLEPGGAGWTTYESREKQILGEFVDLLANKVIKDSQNTQINLGVYGHSLGGALTQYFGQTIANAIYETRKDTVDNPLKKIKSVNLVTFNAAGCSITVRDKFADTLRALQQQENDVYSKIQFYCHISMVAGDPVQQTGESHIGLNQNSDLIKVHLCKINHGRGKDLDLYQLWQNAAQQPTINLNEPIVDTDFFQIMSNQISNFSNKFIQSCSVTKEKVKEVLPQVVDHLKNTHMIDGYSQDFIRLLGFAGHEFLNNTNQHEQLNQELSFKSSILNSMIVKAAQPLLHKKLIISVDSFKIKFNDLFENLLPNIDDGYNTPEFNNKSIEYTEKNQTNHTYRIRSKIDENITHTLRLEDNDGCTLNTLRQQICEKSGDNNEGDYHKMLLADNKKLYLSPAEYNTKLQDIRTDFINTELFFVSQYLSKSQRDILNETDAQKVINLFRQLQFYEKNNRYVCAHMLSLDGTALKYIPSILKKDVRLVEIAIKQNPEAYFEIVDLDTQDLSNPNLSDSDIENAINKIYKQLKNNVDPDQLYCLVESSLKEVAQNARNKIAQNLQDIGEEASSFIRATVPNVYNACNAACNVSINVTNCLYYLCPRIIPYLKELAVKICSAKCNKASDQYLKVYVYSIYFNNPEIDRNYKKETYDIYHEKTKDEVTSAIEALTQENSALRLQDATGFLKKDREFTLAAVEKNGLALQYAIDRYKNDKDIIAAAVKQNLYALQYASNRMLHDTKFLRDINIHTYLDRIYLDRENRLQLQLGWFRFKFIDGLTAKTRILENMFRPSVVTIIKESHIKWKSINDFNFEHDQDLIFLKAVIVEPRALEFLPHELYYNEKFLLDAIKHNAMVLQYAPQSFRQDDKFMLKAIDEHQGGNTQAFQYAPNQFQNNYYGIPRAKELVEELAWRDKNHLKIDDEDSGTKKSYLLLNELRAYASQKISKEFFTKEMYFDLIEHAIEHSCHEALSIYFTYRPINIKEDGLQPMNIDKDGLHNLLNLVLEKILKNNDAIINTKVLKLLCGEMKSFKGTTYRPIPVLTQTMFLKDLIDSDLFQINQKQFKQFENESKEDTSIDKTKANNSNACKNIIKAETLKFEKIRLFIKYAEVEFIHQKFQNQSLTDSPSSQNSATNAHENTSQSESQIDNLTEKDPFEIIIEQYNKSLKPYRYRAPKAIPQLYAVQFLRLMVQIGDKVGDWKQGDGKLELGKFNNILSEISSNTKNRVADTLKICLGCRHRSLSHLVHCFIHLHLHLLGGKQGAAYYNFWSDFENAVVTLFSIENNSVFHKAKTFKFSDYIYLEDHQRNFSDLVQPPRMGINTFMKLTREEAANTQMTTDTINDNTDRRRMRG